MLSCREVTRLVASDQLPSAGWRTRLAVRMHMVMCEHCNKYAAQLRALGHAIRQLSEGSREDATMVQRVLDRIAGERVTTEPPPPASD